MYLCARCKKKIAGKPLKALNKHWHRHCFRCTKCKLPIQTTNFAIYKKQPYHFNCLKCQGCGMALGNQYVEHNNTLWHPECYYHTISPLCAVCTKPLRGKYYQDFWGNRFCASHINYAKCSSCQRIVCDQLTHGGVRYPDGVVICNLCSENAVKTQQRADYLVSDMRLELQKLGLSLGNAVVPSKLADRDELRTHARHNFHDERPILGLALKGKYTDPRTGRVVKRKLEYILIQKNLPELHFRTIAIHELTHAWFFYSRYPEHLPLVVEEGMCVLMEYLWLKKQGTREAKFRMHAIEQSTDPIYGFGFQQAKKARERLPLKMLMQYIKEKHKFPSAIAAFFYY